LIGFREKNEIG